MTSSSLSELFGKLSTSTKMILILSVALMPLGLVALMASIQTTRTADGERHAQLTIATNEAARKLSTEFASDIFALRQATLELEAAPGDVRPCARVQALLSAQSAQPLPFALLEAGGRPLCSTIAGSPIAPTLPPPGKAAARRTGDAVDLVVSSPLGRSMAMVRYSKRRLADFARPSAFGLPYRLSLDLTGEPFVIEDLLSTDALTRTDNVAVPAGVDDVSVSMTSNKISFSIAEILVTFLPLVMWGSAAVVAFYVVERLLIHPLRLLRSAVANYQPAAPAPLVLPATPAIEIRELGASFMAFADRLAEREKQLEASLDHQRRLTREVHHRVKNNLQIIASLISLHARDTQLNDATVAYGSIQRRVDALAIVHRNHFAELENNRGIDFRALLGELVSNFRANAAQAGQPISISVYAETLCVDQDTAMPLAFLFTELAELSLYADAAALLTASARAVHAGVTAELELRSSVFCDKSKLTSGPSLRIVDGLARQLRSPLRYDAEHGIYSVTFAINGPDPEDRVFW